MTIFRDCNGNPTDPFVTQAVLDACHICGHKADAFWHANKSISVCYQCSLSVMPSLIADAMRAHWRDTHMLHQTKRRMDERFWRAVAGALACDGPTRMEANACGRTPATVLNGPSTEQ